VQGRLDGFFNVEKRAAASADVPPGKKQKSKDDKKKNKGGKAAKAAKAARPGPKRL